MTDRPTDKPTNRLVSIHLNECSYREVALPIIMMMKIIMIIIIMIILIIN